MTSVERFRRTMRRIERRVRHGRGGLAHELRAVRLSAVARPGGYTTWAPASWAQNARDAASEVPMRPARRDMWRREAWAWARAADAVARLRAAIGGAP